MYNIDDGIKCDMCGYIIRSDLSEDFSEIEMDEDMKGFTVSRSDDYGFSTFSFHSTDEDLVKRVLKDYKKF